MRYITSLMLIFLFTTNFGSASDHNMEQNNSNTKYLKDYTPSDFLVESLDLTFDLTDDYTMVTSLMKVNRSANIDVNTPLVLDGKDQELIEVKLNDKVLNKQQYHLTSSSLTIPTNLNKFTVTVVSKIKPQDNTSLEGLYKAADDLYLTQCEPLGFRNIAYFLDRPDVMTVYTTKIIADKKFPILLSNGDKIDQGDLPNNKHFVVWHDKTKKPSYLFALVVGDLKVRENTYTTMSGKVVDLKIYVPEKDLIKTQYAMESLIAAMKWDEKVYNLEYDLGTYMIVGTPKFNAGAMENKGLNIFNNKYILASNDSATDSNYEDVRAVIGHEYFHNWSGNRVTLRDWFQLSLKEGFTVFRDSEFTADEFSRTVKRIEDAKFIRSVQFQEDSGPLSHPVRPESYIQMDNFYTVTVYEKGAEVIRMIKTIIGDKNFFKGVALYFKRHDGQAVTTDDFVAAMEDVSNIDLTQFKLWYSQSGTPIVDVSSSYDKSKKTYQLKFKQSNDKNSLHAGNKPFYIPIKMGLIGSVSGKSLEFIENGNLVTEIVLGFKEAEQVFEFSGVQEEPIPSLFRDFSAPVKVHYSYSDEQLLLLLTNDSNAFNKWDAGQKYYTKFLLKQMAGLDKSKQEEDSSKIANTIASLIADPKLDQAFVAMAVTLPSLTEIFEMLDIVDPEELFQTRENLVKIIGKEIKPQLLDCYNKLNIKLSSKPYALTKQDIAARALKNTCLSYIAQSDSIEGEKLALAQLNIADNFTDRMAALAIIKDTKDDTLFNKTFSEFYEKWKDDDLLIQKWLSLQALSERSDALDRVKLLINHPAFDIQTPNHVYAIIGGFVANYPSYHKKDGTGYNFIADFIIKLDGINPKVAARMIKNLGNFKKLEPVRSKLLKQALIKIKNHDGLSEDSKELVENILK